MRKRTAGREIALMMLADADVHGADALESFQSFLESKANQERDRREANVAGAAREKEYPEEPDFARMALLYLDAEVRDFANRLARGTLDARSVIDEIIQAAAQNWNLSRMALLDRNIMRMAVYEMLHEPDIPSKVSINEAIELGKRYSTQQSGAFINGILDRIRRERKL
jgi:N utilization substance protein B